MDWMELLGLSGFEDFEQIELNELKALERKHRGHVLKAGRRFVAAMLAAAMLLPAAVNLTTEARAAEEEIYPPQVTRLADGTSPDDPRIEIESNLVHDKYGFLTNTLELGIRVQSPMIDAVDSQGAPILDADGNQVVLPRPVQAISVNLAFNAQVLHPVSWKWTRGESATAVYDVVTNVDNYYDLKLETQKDSRIQTAAANSGVVQNPATAGYNLGSQAVMDGEQGLIHFAARAFAPEAFPEMTTIAVIRFAVADELMEHIELRRNGENYAVLYDGVEMTDLIALQSAMTATATATGSTATALPLMEFPLQKDIEDAADKAASLESTLLHYSDEFTEMNYIPDFDHTNPATESVTRVINGDSYTLDRPNTSQSPSKPTSLGLDWDGETLTLARKDDPAATPTVDYSYTTNLIHSDNVTFTLVSKETFLTRVDEDQTVLVYVDWDNRIMGTQIVPKKTDVRGLVSDYVSENFIYHDDDASTYNERFDLNDPAQIAEALTSGGMPTEAEDIVSSLERKYSYRGKYPATGPMGLDSDGNTLHDSLDTVVDEMANMPKGSAYPLTNKLDYVFFKRPMTHTDQTTKPDKADPKYDAASDPDGSKYEADYNAWYFAKTEWSQKTIVDSNGDPTSDPYWDVEHPYAYGWALCTVDNYEDVWTTLGMGELGSTKLATEAASLAAQTGSDMGYSGAVNTATSSGGYQDLSTAQNTIASVTYDGDAAFAFADLEKGFTDSTVFLKAIYEPGKDLMGTDRQYSLISKPYYNKLNRLSASEGGAYSVDVTFERAMTLDNVRRGVARTREPYVRQDVTTDLRWVTSDAPKVENDLTNADNNSAYYDKLETAYIQIGVENTDIINFSLTLSARHNKADYYLKEGYGANFVSGGERSDKDILRSVKEQVKVMDNYNYYVKGESDETDNWYDATYENREGSYGFVLQGTLNQFMKMATQANRGEITESEFNNIISVGTLKDANLYMSEGKPATTYAQLTNMRQYIRDAADMAETAHNGGDDTYWNTDHDWAELTYHQLQGYLIQRTGGTGTPTINHPETTLTALTWCHLHADCAAASSKAPTTWAELIDAARNNPQYIDLMTQATAEKLAKLRKDINGTVNNNGEAFTSITDFKATIVNAVSNLDTAAGGSSTTIWSWNDVQKQILIDNGAPNASALVPDEDFWWYDGATTSVVDNFSKFLTAIKHATDATLEAPDGNAHARDAKLNQLLKAYTDNKAAANASYAATAPAWVAGTENLAITDTTQDPDQQEGRPFASFADFKQAAKDAYDLLKVTYENPDWYQFQYVILHYSDVQSGALSLPIPRGQAGAPSEYAGYWWHDGGISIKNLKDLLTAANNAYNGNAGALNGFTETDLYNPSYAVGTATAAGLGLRKDFAGTPFTSADIGDLRTYATAYSQIPVGTGFGERPSDPSEDWDTFQYYIIHGGTMPVVDSDRDDEAAYYWWKNGGSAQEVDFTTFQSETDSVKRADALAAAIMDAVFRATYNGNTVAWDQLDADAATILESGRLVKAWAGTEADFPSDFSAANELLTAADLSDLKALAKELMDIADGNVGAANPTHKLPRPTTVTWETIQYALLNNSPTNTYPVPAPTGTTGGYWWKKEDSKTTPIEEEYEKLHLLIEDVVNQVAAGGAGSAAAQVAAVNAFLKQTDAGGMTMAEKLSFKGKGGSARNPTYGMTLTATMIDNINWANVNYGAAGCYDNGYFELTWYQVQYIFYKSPAIVNAAQAESEVQTGANFKNVSAVAPSWYANVTWPITSTSATSLFGGNMMMLMAPNMLAMKAPATAEELTNNAAATSERMENDAALRNQLTESGYADELIRQLELLGYDVSSLKPSQPTTENKDNTNNTGNAGTDTTYTVTKDTEVAVVEIEEKEPDTTDDNNSQSTSQIQTAPESGTSTVPVDEKDTGTDVPMSPAAQPAVPDADTDDDDRSQTASDPPVTPEDSLTAPPLESVTGLRLLGDGRTRFRASPQRSPWIRFPAQQTDLILVSRRTLA